MRDTACNRELRCEVAGSIRTLSDRIPTARTTFPMARVSSRLGVSRHRESNHHPDLRRRGQRPHVHPHHRVRRARHTRDAGPSREPGRRAVAGEPDRGRVMTLTEHESTAAVKEALVSLVATAKRCPRVTAKLSTDEPTMYDRRHADVNALLDRLFPPT